MTEFAGMGYKNERPYVYESACFCMGPQNGEPLCPCKMREVTVIDGRYVKIEDLGPVGGVSDD